MSLISSLAAISRVLKPICPSWEQMSSSHARCLCPSVRISADQPCVQSLSQFDQHAYKFSSPYWAYSNSVDTLRSHYRFRSIALITQCLNPHFIDWRHFTHIGTIVKVIFKINCRNYQQNYSASNRLQNYVTDDFIIGNSVSRYSLFWNKERVFGHKFYCKNFLNARKSLGGISATPIILKRCSTIKCCWYLHVGIWWINKCVNFRIELLRKLRTNLEVTFLCHSLYIRIGARKQRSVLVIDRKAQIELIRHEQRRTTASTGSQSGLRNQPISVYAYLPSSSRLS